MQKPKYVRAEAHLQHEWKITGDNIKGCQLLSVYTLPASIRSVDVTQYI